MLVGTIIFSIIASFAIAFLTYAKKDENGALDITHNKKTQFLLIFIASLPFTFVLGLLIAFRSGT